MASGECRELKRIASSNYEAKANMLSKKLAGVITMALMWVPSFAAYSAEEPLVFNTTTPTSDLKGSLAARVQFAQSQIRHLAKKRATTSLI